MELNQKIKFIIKGTGKVLTPEENAKLKEQEAKEKAAKDDRKDGDVLPENEYW